MLFSSTVFIFFFLPVVLILYYGLFNWNRKIQNLILMIASLFFYAWGEPRFVFIMLALILADWFFALLISETRKDKPKLAKFLCAIAVTLNLSVLFIYKYLSFSIFNVNRFARTEFSVPDIVLPIGISFFTFQAISYVVDITRGNGIAQRNPINVILYISFFPQLIAGPIVRYKTVAEQIENRKETFSSFSEGLCRFVLGLGKKVLIANNLAIVADTAFNATSNSVVFAWMGAIAYTFQIYFDFSGYSDMAIGLGKMFGFKFLENFNFPYISKSISEFWRRWHISLTSWFRDYVFLPLISRRKSSSLRLIGILLIVWFLTGFWHGANFQFIAWGLMYFALLTFERLTGLDKKINWIGHIYTMFFVIIGWVIFRATKISAAFIYIKSMFGLTHNPFFDDTAILYFNEYKFFFAAALLFSLPISRFLEKKMDTKLIWNILYPLLLCLIFFISVSYIIKGSYNPFIYFNF